MATQTDTKANIGIITLGAAVKKLPPPPFQQEGGGEEGCSEEPELNHDQNIEVRDRELQVAGRLKYFLSVWMDITSDRKILDMVEHCYLELTENPNNISSLQLDLILKRLQLLMVKYNNYFAKGF